MLGVRGRDTHGTTSAVAATIRSFESVAAWPYRSSTQADIGLLRTASARGAARIRLAPPRHHPGRSEGMRWDPVGCLCPVHGHPLPDAPKGSFKIVTDVMVNGPDVFVEREGRIDKAGTAIRGGGVGPAPDGARRGTVDDGPLYLPLDRWKCSHLPTRIGGYWAGQMLGARRPGAGTGLAIVLVASPRPGRRRRATGTCNGSKSTAPAPIRGPSSPRGHLSSGCHQAIYHTPRLASLGVSSSGRDL